MTAAEVLRLRQRLGLTQVALAARLGVHSVTVCRWETEAVRIPEPTARLLRLLVQTAPKKKSKRRR